MSPDREILTALLYEASRQSEPFQSLIHDYSADVMNDPEVHRLFTARLDANLPMRREIETLKASLCVPAAKPLSQAMNDVLLAADALPAGSHTSLREIADLAAVELVYKRRDAAPRMNSQSLLLLVLAVLASCASPAVVMGADDPQATKAVARDAVSTDKPPMIIHNPDGTFTVQKVPPKEQAKDAAKNGLVIPPQVVVPLMPRRESRK